MSTTPLQSLQTLVKLELKDPIQPHHAVAGHLGSVAVEHAEGESVPDQHHSCNSSVSNTSKPAGPVLAF